MRTIRLIFVGLWLFLLSVEVLVVDDATCLILNSLSHPLLQHSCIAEVRLAGSLNSSIRTWPDNWRQTLRIMYLLVHRPLSVCSPFFFEESYRCGQVGSIGDSVGSATLMDCTNADVDGLWFVA